MGLGRFQPSQCIGERMMMVDLKSISLGTKHLTVLISIPNDHEDVNTHLLMGLFQKLLCKGSKFLICKPVKQVRIDCNTVVIQAGLTWPEWWHQDQLHSIAQKAFHSLPAVQE
jgi:hypothetical protein